MSIRPHTLFVILLSTLLFSCAGNKKTLSDKFFDYTNTYDTNKLSKLLSDDFKMKRTYISFVMNKDKFLNEYISMSRRVNGRFIVLQSSGSEYVVKDQSDYLTYLGIPSPTWKMSVVSKDNKIETVTVDTTETYRTYLAEVKNKSKAFEEWLHKKYPSEEELQKLENAGTRFYVKQLKAYAKSK